MSYHANLDGARRAGECSLRISALPGPTDPYLRCAGPKGHRPADGLRSDERARAELAVVRDPGDGEGDVELGEERAEHVPDARLPSERQAVHVRAADEDGVGPQRQRPVDVGPRADARAEQDGDLAADRVRDPRQDVDRPGRAGPRRPRSFDTTMPSKPRRTAIRASGTVWMPPRTIGPSQASRIAASAAQPFPGCGGESTRWVHPASLRALEQREVGAVPCPASPGRTTASLGARLRRRSRPTCSNATSGRT